MGTVWQLLTFNIKAEPLPAWKCGAEFLPSWAGSLNFFSLIKWAISLQCLFPDVWINYLHECKKSVLPEFDEWLNTREHGQEPCPFTCSALCQCCGRDRLCLCMALSWISWFYFSSSPPLSFLFFHFFFFPSFTAPLSGAMCRCVAPCCIRSWEMQSWFICPIILLQFSFMVLMSSSLQRSAPIISMRQYTSEWCTSDVYHYSSIIFPWAGTAVAVKTSESSVSSLCTHGSAHRTSSNRHTRT